MEDVSDPAFFRPMRFDTLEETVRHAKRATFTYSRVETTQGDAGSNRLAIIPEARLFPCPLCQQPLYQKAKLGRFGNRLDLDDWGCPRCKKTVTLKTDDLVSAGLGPPRQLPSPSLSP